MRELYKVYTSDDVVARLRRCDELCRELESLLKSSSVPKTSIWIEMIRLEVNKLLREHVDQQKAI